MAGRPPLYSSTEDLIAAIEEYFAKAEGVTAERMVTVTDKNGDEHEQKELYWLEKPYPITITGLALALGFESRQSIYDYEKDGEFSYIIKNARLRVENAYERTLYSDKPTGAIFALKNMGWKDNQRTELTGENGGPISLPAITVQVVSAGAEIAEDESQVK